ncbi:MAG: hypothetical protein MZV49_11820 [Rhodopseudomonas palustris]|nr:hypothetical protein [Rhodopseudomonas palustris]
MHDGEEFAPRATGKDRGGSLDIDDLPNGNDRTATGRTDRDDRPPRLAPPPSTWQRSMMSASWNYQAPRWLPGGHAQTIWPALFARPYRREAPPYQRERWLAPDGDFIDVDHFGCTAGAPWLVLFHGLEGSSSSHYAIASRTRGAGAWLEFQRAAFPRLFRRAQSGAAQLSFRRFRRDRLDACAHPRAGRGAGAGCRRLARRQCAAALGRRSRRPCRRHRACHRRHISAA